jgi:CRISPR-associated endonuclease/helicase Cas3
MTMKIDDQMPDPLGILWGKSDAGGRMHLLLGHLLDTAAVGELIWDRFLSPVFRTGLDEVCGKRGREFFSLICGLHDIGKATPAFQSKDKALAEKVRAAGLNFEATPQAMRKWHHTLAGSVVVKRVFEAARWSPDAVQWVWPLVAGHHGRVPSGNTLNGDPLGRSQGTGKWLIEQDRLVDRVVTELGLDLADFAQVGRPSRAFQLALSGAIIMADWIASEEKNFTGIDDLSALSIKSARVRAETAWQKLAIRGGWDPDSLFNDGDLIRSRFGREARPIQRVAISMAEAMPAAGLVLLEWPMGEGKTEAALAVTEILARRFGADGLFVGMPTQATSDPMFGRVKSWLGDVDSAVPIALLHGKRRFNQEWRAIEQQVRFKRIGEVDEFGCTESYGDETGGGSASSARAEWLLGRKRGLLTACVIGTIDQLLYAATRTKHVMLRHAGLAGKVVVLDEVHAYDIYMSQFLYEALRWLGEAQVPVVVLSATLPPAMRKELVRAYLQGATGERDIDLKALPVSSGYPNVLSVCAVDRAPVFQEQSALPWRPSVDVAVEILDEPAGEGPEAVVAVIREALEDGGCALVIRNTVTRAQATYTALKAEFGAEVNLLHARLTAGERADRTEQVLGLLGAPGRTDAAERPHRMIVVATQLAEQSFDVDADLLVTDLAPIDLLLQRAGRLHRHERGERPGRVSRPRMVVTGFVPGRDGPPKFPGGPVAVYGEHLLLRAAALVQRAAGERWSIPAQVPELVAEGYGAEGNGELALPGDWADAAGKAEAAWNQKQRTRQEKAGSFLLAGEDELGAPTLECLHERSTADLDEEDPGSPVVRDGDPSAEVILVRRDEQGYYTLRGDRLGINGEAISDPAILDLVVQDTVRLPAGEELTKAAEDELRPLAGWTGDSWLSKTRALVLDEESSAVLGGYRLSYDKELGLSSAREKKR